MSQKGYIRTVNSKVAIVTGERFKSRFDIEGYRSKTKDCLAVPARVAFWLPTLIRMRS